jgi:hypothetical protein
MGSVRPARRFDAHRALARPSVPSRLSPDGGPPCAFAPLQRSIAAPPHRPANPKARRRTMLPLLGFLALRHVPGRRTRSRGASGSAACRVRGFDLPRGLHHRPSRALRRGASMGFTLQGVLLEAIGTSCEAPCLRDVGHVDSPRPPGERADAVAFKASIPLRARSAVPDPEGPGAPMPSWVSPLQSTNPASVASALGRGAIPSHALGGIRRPVPPASQGLAERETWPPLSGWPALLGFVTDDRRETA